MLYVQMEWSNLSNFDQKKYISDYNKKSYKRLQVDVKPNIYIMIDDYCKNKGISKATLITRACKYIIDNNIDISDI